MSTECFYEIVHSESVLAIVIFLKNKFVTASSDFITISLYGLHDGHKK